jgi:flagellar hook-associated protein 2
MGATTSVDGLVSGLSTSDLISQLMKVESIPKTKVEQKITTQKAVNTALQAVNTKLKAIFTAADSLTKSSGLDLTKATSSSDAITATATGAAATGSLTFDVKTLAKAHVTTSPFATAATPAVTDTNAGIFITIGGGAPVNITIDPAKNTPQGVADAINAKGLNVKAAAVDTGSGIILQLTSTKTGAANAFTVSGLTSPVNIAAQGVNAAIEVGAGTAGVYTVTSASNSFTGLMQGVTLTATKVATGVTVGVAKDNDGIAAKVSSMVDAANSALAEIALKADPKVASSQLKGNSLVRQTASAILSSVAGGQVTEVNGVNEYTSFASIGVQLDKGGRLAFDKDKFMTALTNDPVGTAKLVQEGLAKNLAGVADGATNSTTGSLTQVLKNGETTIARLTTEITSWDTRLELRQNALKKQFSNLEVALSKMKSQSSWLAGQLSALG